MDQHLEFEQPIYTCLEKIEQLKKIVPAPANLAEEISALEKQSKEETEKIYSNLSLLMKFICINFQKYCVVNIENIILMEF